MTEMGNSIQRSTLADAAIDSSVTQSSCVLYGSSRTHHGVGKNSAATGQKTVKNKNGVRFSSCVESGE